MNEYLEPFNSVPYDFISGDRVVDRHGIMGIIRGSEDFDGYEHNRPTPKWELVEWDNGDRNWIGNIWIKKVAS